MIYPLGIAFTLLILTVGLYRSIFSKNAKEVDDPFHLVGWSVVAMFLVLSSTQLLQYFIDMMAMAEAYLNSTLLATTDVSSITDLTVWEDLSSTIFPRSIADTTVADSCGAIVSIIFIFLLGWKFLQLMFLYSARYVQYFLVCLLSPLGFSPLASVKTKEITQRYLRLFVSSILSLLLTKIIIYIYSYLMISTISWNASDGHGFGMRIFMLSITLAFYKVAGRIDDYLSQLGLTNVSSANEVPRFPMMAMMAARGLGRMASGTAQAVASGGEGRDRHYPVHHAPGAGRCCSCVRRGFPGGKRRARDPGHVIAE
ncbi:MAG: hypothetical protein LUE14_04620 [Clostridiales bacterium]|nr:hypothetical protein [Clostridiales bacterium]